MKFTLLKWLVSLTFSILIPFLTQVSFKGYPSLGGLLNPLTGIWSNRPNPRPKNLYFDGLKEPTTIHWDSYHVPHIFAQNKEDLFFTQGYLLASDRLFQMDILTRSGLGRSSEIINQPKAIQRDQLMVSMGLRESARRKMKSFMADPDTRQQVLSYINGVNTYIGNLRNPPIEYKMLNVHPEKWTPERISGLLNLMGWMLSGNNKDIELTKLAKEHGFENMETIFNFFPHRSLPIMREFKKKQPEKKSLQDGFISELSDVLPLNYLPKSNNGSNSWAIHPNLTTNSKTLFANDTHLDFFIPSIWYELQLHTPHLNIYGGSLPGAPGITIGLNENIAWGMTNATSDVFDWFEVEFKDEESLEYKHDNMWRIAKRVLEEIKIKGQPSLFIEQIWTHHGVVYKRLGRLALVLKINLHEASNELKSLHLLSQAKNLYDCKEAISHFKSPAQNILCVDAENIGIWHQGFFPKRWFGQGRYILDGRRSDHDWQGWLQPEDMPFEINPKRGYVHSANQPPVSPDLNLYLGAQYIDSYRALAIDKRIRETNEYTPKKMIEIQNDTQDLRTLELKPILLKHVHKNKMNPEQIRSLDVLEEWNGNYDIELMAPALFDLWYEKLIKKIWSDQFTPFGKTIYPPRSSMVRIIQQASEKNSWALQWIDDIETEIPESLEDVITETFLQSWKELENRLGPDTRKWSLGRSRVTILKHILNISAFSISLPTPGVVTSISANSIGHGASWKIVAEIGKNEPPRAWVNYPGGPSGNPFDPKYSLFVKPWSQGKMREVYFYNSLPSIKNGTGYQQHLKPIQFKREKE